MSKLRIAELLLYDVGIKIIKEGGMKRMFIDGIQPIIKKRFYLKDFQIHSIEPDRRNHRKLRDVNMHGNTIDNTFHQIRAQHLTQS